MITLSHASKTITGAVKLPGSKSIAARMAVIEALSGRTNHKINPSEALDVQTIQYALANYTTESFIDVGESGTAFRFLTAFLSIQPQGEWMLTGSPRLMERPIKPLVTALNELGAEITYLKKQGFAPLHIKGRSLEGGKVKISANISSQFISALMLVGATLPNGLEIVLKGEAVSEYYLMLTCNLMNSFGANVVLYPELIVSPQPYELPYDAMSTFTISAEASTVSYFYSILALAEAGSSLDFESVFESSSLLATTPKNLYKPFGVNQILNAKGFFTLSKIDKDIEYNTYDLTSEPDQILTLAVLLAAKGCGGRIIGTSTLPHKETNRAEALRTELGKMGCDIEVLENEIIIPIGSKLTYKEPINTYNDHRMAMAFAPLALIFPKIEILDEMVVKKSFPMFWHELERLGFVVERN